MTLLAMESFGHLPDGAITSSDIASNVFDGVSGGFSITDMTGGRKYIKSTNVGGNGNLPVILSASSTTIYVGFRLHNLAAGSETEVFEFRDGANVLGILVKAQTNSRLQYKAGPNFLSPNVLESTGATSIGSDDYWVVKIIFDNAAGAVEFYKNGVLDSSISGVDTIYQGATCTAIDIFDGYYTVGYFGISDFYVDSATNHGEVKCCYRPVDADGSSTDWTPTGQPSNYECVDEVPPNDDTDYNRSTVSTDLDQLEQTGMDGESGTVLAVQVHARGKKEDASSGKIKLGLLYSGNHLQSAELGLDTDWQNFSAIFETAPGGGAWSPAAFDATEVSYQNMS